MKLIIITTFKISIGNRMVAVNRFHNLRYIITIAVDFNDKLSFEEQKNNFS